MCEKLLADPLMADGYNAIGISQGGLLIRLDQRESMDILTAWILAGFKANVVQGVGAEVSHPSEELDHLWLPPPGRS